jgi:hypothetical protein
MNVVRPRKRIIRATQTWFKKRLPWLPVFEMVAFRIHRWFWRCWSVSLAGLAFTYPHAPHAVEALAVSLIIEIIGLFCEVQEKQAQKRWLATR